MGVQASTMGVCAPATSISFRSLRADPRVLDDAFFGCLASAEGTPRTLNDKLVATWMRSLPDTAPGLEDLPVAITDVFAGFNGAVFEKTFEEASLKLAVVLRAQYHVWATQWMREVRAAAVTRPTETPATSSAVSTVDRQSQPALRPEAALASLAVRSTLHVCYTTLKKSLQTGEDVDVCVDILSDAMAVIELLPAGSLFDCLNSPHGETWSLAVRRIFDILSLVKASTIPEIALLQPRTLLMGLQLVSLTGDALLLLKTIETYLGDASTSAPILPVLRAFAARFDIDLNEVQAPAASTETATETVQPLSEEASIGMIRHQYKLLSENPEVPLAQAALFMLSCMGSDHSPQRSPKALRQYFSCGRTFLNALCTSSPIATAHTPQTTYAASHLVKLRPSLLCTGHIFTIAHSSKTTYIVGPKCPNDPVSELSPIPELQGLTFTHFAALQHVLAVTSEGKVFAWGLSKHKLGRPGSCSTPARIDQLDAHFIVAASCGTDHSAVLTREGRVLTWGKGNYGRLGHGNSDDLEFPKLVEALANVKIVQVCCGTGDDGHTIALAEDGSVYTWGDGDHGKLGHDSTNRELAPRKIQHAFDQSPVKFVQGGNQCSLALTQNGKVFTWGKGDDHRTGFTDTQIRKVPTLVRSLEGEVVVNVALTYTCAVAITASGNVYMWGAFANGSDRATPFVKLTALCGIGLNGVSVTTEHVIFWTDCDTGLGVVPFSPSPANAIQTTESLSSILTQLQAQVPLGGSHQALIERARSSAVGLLGASLKAMRETGSRLSADSTKALLAKTKHTLLGFALAKDAGIDLSIAAQQCLRAAWSRLDLIPDEQIALREAVFDQLVFCQEHNLPQLESAKALLDACLPLFFSTSTLRLAALHEQLQKQAHESSNARLIILERLMAVCEGRKDFELAFLELLSVESPVPVSELIILKVVACSLRQVATTPKAEASSDSSLWRFLDQFHRCLLGNLVLESEELPKLIGATAAFYCAQLISLMPTLLTSDSLLNEKSNAGRLFELLHESLVIVWDCGRRALVVGKQAPIFRARIWDPLRRDLRAIISDLLAGCHKTLLNEPGILKRDSLETSVGDQIASRPSVFFKPLLRSRGTRSVTFETAHPIQRTAQVWTFSEPLAAFVQVDFHANSSIESACLILRNAAGEEVAVFSGKSGFGGFGPMIVPGDFVKFEFVPGPNPVGWGFKATVTAFVHPKMSVLKPVVTPAPLVCESEHPYPNNADTTQTLIAPGADFLILSFAPNCASERRYDHVQIFRPTPTGDQQIHPENLSGPSDAWPKSSILVLDTSQVKIKFHSDGSNNDWGYKITARGYAIQGDSASTTGVSSQTESSLHDFTRLLASLYGALEAEEISGLQFLADDAVAQSWASSLLCTNGLSQDPISHPSFVEELLAVEPALLSAGASRCQLFASRMLAYGKKASRHLGFPRGPSHPLWPVLVRTAATLIFHTDLSREALQFCVDSSSTLEIPASLQRVFDSVFELEHSLFTFHRLEVMDYPAIIAEVTERANFLMQSVSPFLQSPAVAMGASSATTDAELISKRKLSSVVKESRGKLTRTFSVPEEPLAAHGVRGAPSFDRIREFEADGAQLLLTGKQRFNWLDERTVPRHLRVKARTEGLPERREETERPLIQKQILEFLSAFMPAHPKKCSVGQLRQALQTRMRRAAQISFGLQQFAETLKQTRSLLPSVRSQFLVSFARLRMELATTSAAPVPADPSVHPQQKLVVHELRDMLRENLTVLLGWIESSESSIYEIPKSVLSAPFRDSLFALAVLATEEAPSTLGSFLNDFLPFLLRVMSALDDEAALRVLETKAHLMETGQAQTTRLFILGHEHDLTTCESDDFWTCALCGLQACAGTLRLTCVDHCSFDICNFCAKASIAVGQVVTSKEAQVGVVVQLRESFAREGSRAATGKIAVLHESPTLLTKAVQCECTTQGKERLPNFCHVVWSSGERTLCAIGADGCHSLLMPLSAARLDDLKTFATRPGRPPVTPIDAWRKVLDLFLQRMAISCALAANSHDKLMPTLLQSLRGQMEKARFAEAQRILLLLSKICSSPASRKLLWGADWRAQLVRCIRDGPTFTQILACSLLVQSAEACTDDCQTEAVNILLDLLATMLQQRSQSHSPFQYSAVLHLVKHIRELFEQPSWVSPLSLRLSEMIAQLPVVMTLCQQPHSISPANEHAIFHVQAALLIVGADVELSFLLGGRVSHSSKGEGTVLGIDVPAKQALIALDVVGRQVPEIQTFDLSQLSPKHLPHFALENAEPALRSALQQAFVCSLSWSALRLPGSDLVARGDSGSCSFQDIALLEIHALLLETARLVSSNPQLLIDACQSQPQFAHDLLAGSVEPCELKPFTTKDLGASVRHLIGVARSLPETKETSQPPDVIDPLLSLEYDSVFLEPPVQPSVWAVPTALTADTTSDASSKPVPPADVLRFDSSKSVDGARVSPDGKTVRRTSSGSRCYVLGTRALTTGKHSWKLQIVTEKPGDEGTFIGIARPGVHAADADTDHMQSGMAWLYSAYSGRFYHRGSIDQPGSKFTAGDIITVELDLTEGTLSYQKNADPPQLAFRGILDETREVFPMIYFVDKNDQEVAFVDSSPVGVLPVKPSSTASSPAVSFSPPPDPLGQAQFVGPARALPFEHFPHVALDCALSSVKTPAFWFASVNRLVRQWQLSLKRDVVLHLARAGALLDMQLDSHLIVLVALDLLRLSQSGRLEQPDASAVLSDLLVQATSRPSAGPLTEALIGAVQTDFERCQRLSSEPSGQASQLVVAAPVLGTALHEISVSDVVYVPGATALEISWVTGGRFEAPGDRLELVSLQGSILGTCSFEKRSDWRALRIEGSAFKWCFYAREGHRSFTSSWSFSVSVAGQSSPCFIRSERDILKQPSQHVIFAIMNVLLEKPSKAILPQLAQLLARIVMEANFQQEVRTWAVTRLNNLLASGNSDLLLDAVPSPPLNSSDEKDASAIDVLSASICLNQKGSYRSASEVLALLTRSRSDSPGVHFALRGVAQLVAASPLPESRLPQLQEDLGVVTSATVRIGDRVVLNPDWHEVTPLQASRQRVGTVTELFASASCPRALVSVLWDGESSSQRFNVEESAQLKFALHLLQAGTANQELIRAPAQDPPGPTSSAQDVSSSETDDPPPRVSAPDLERTLLKSSGSLQRSSRRLASLKFSLLRFLVETIRDQHAAEKRGVDLRTNLLHTPYLKSLVALAARLGVDQNFDLISQQASRWALPPEHTDLILRTPAKFVTKEGRYQISFDLAHDNLPIWTCGPNFLYSASGKWHLGDVLGSTRAFLYAQTEAELPTDPSIVWRAAVGNGRWEAAPKVAIVPFAEARCSRAEHGSTFIAQSMYECKTCKLTMAEQKGVCLVCFLRCHSGHVAAFRAFISEFFCDCENTECTATAPRTSASPRSACWPWLAEASLTLRTLDSLQSRKAFPADFVTRLTQKLTKLMPAHRGDRAAPALLQSLYLAPFDNTQFSPAMDEQLVSWQSSAPAAWMKEVSLQPASAAFLWHAETSVSRLFLFPTVHEQLAQLNPLTIRGELAYVVCISADGGLWETSDHAQAPLCLLVVDSGVTFTDLAVRGPHRLALTASGIIFQWQQDWSQRTVHTLPDVRMTQLACGSNHFAALDERGLLYTWGGNQEGCLGHGNQTDLSAPTVVQALADHPASSVACGSAHTLVLTDSGAFVWAFGSGRDGQLANSEASSSVPQRIQALDGLGLVSVHAGDSFSIALASSSQVYSWGFGAENRLGHGDDLSSSVPRVISGLPSVVDQIAVGPAQVIVRGAGGELVAWGPQAHPRASHPRTGTLLQSEDLARSCLVRRVPTCPEARIASQRNVVGMATRSTAASDRCRVSWDDGSSGEYLLGENHLQLLFPDEPTMRVQSHTHPLTLPSGASAVNRIACGTGVNFVWSHLKTERADSGLSIPVKFDKLQGLRQAALQGRLAVLKLVSELVLGSLRLLSIVSSQIERVDSPLEQSRNLMRHVIPLEAKETILREVLKSTMNTAGDHGPDIAIDRLNIKLNRHGLAGPHGSRSVFAQLMRALMIPKHTNDLMRGKRVWKVNLSGEGATDAGGAYSDSISSMCDELHQRHVPLLIPSPNMKQSVGYNQDAYLLNPASTKPEHLEMFRFLGVLMGIAIRTASPINLCLATPVWRQLSGRPLSLADLTEVALDYVAGLEYIRDLPEDAESFDRQQFPCTTPSSDDREVQVIQGTCLTLATRHEYVRRAVQHRLHEFDAQTNAVRQGLSQVVPLPLLSLFSGQQLETLVCGDPSMDLALLKSMTEYKGVDPQMPLIVWFWEVMEAFSSTDRALFLRFVWGRTRLPRTKDGFENRKFSLQVLTDKYRDGAQNPNAALPMSATCFFTLKLPPYSSKAALQEKLTYAIHHCQVIDTDGYARTDLTLAVVDDDDDDA
eukprot:m.913445 g.913445  ORF g.913445 m.913445 type:complete len:4429 (-) comp60130_c2_seq1:227-13513(-)